MIILKTYLMTNKAFIAELYGIVPDCAKEFVETFDQAIINLAKNSSSYSNAAYAICDLLNIPGHSCVKEIEGIVHHFQFYNTENDG